MEPDRQILIDKIVKVGFLSLNKVKWINTGHDGPLYTKLNSALFSEGFFVLHIELFKFSDIYRVQMSQLQYSWKWGTKLNAFSIRVLPYSLGKHLTLTCIRTLQCLIFNTMGILAAYVCLHKNFIVPLHKDKHNFNPSTDKILNFTTCKVMFRQFIGHETIIA